MTWRAISGRPYLLEFLRQRRVQRGQGGGSLRTSTRIEIGRARKTHLQGKCSYGRADWVRQFSVDRVLVFNDPLPGRTVSGTGPSRPPTRDWQMLPATSSNAFFNPRFSIHMASYDVAKESNIWPPLPASGPDSRRRRWPPPSTRAPRPGTRGLHSSSFRLIISAFGGIRWVVHGVLVTKTAQVELRSGRV